MSRLIPVHTSKDAEIHSVLKVQEEISFARVVFKFVFNQAHILQKYPKLTIQQVINQPDISKHLLAGKDILK